MNKRRIVILVFLILLVITIAASITLGSRRISLEELTGGLLHPSVSSYGANVVRKRVIRTVFSLLCGAALGVSGALMQAVTRNPIADPSILGVNTGAAFFVVCGIAFFHISTARTVHSICAGWRYAGRHCGILHWLHGKRRRYAH